MDERTEYLKENMQLHAENQRLRLANDTILHTVGMINADELIAALKAELGEARQEEEAAATNTEQIVNKAYADGLDDAIWYVRRFVSKITQEVNNERLY